MSADARLCVSILLTVTLESIPVLPGRDNIRAVSRLLTGLAKV